MTSRVVAAARRATILSGTLSVVFWCGAFLHIGSPDTFFEGKAGPYPVRVIIRSPTVIPARAEIIVRVTGSGVQRVTATARIWDGGEKGAPPVDELTRVPGDSSLWTLQLWVMRQGSYAVPVRVEGAAGSGTVIVPYTAVALGVLKMDRTLGLALGALAVFLVAGLLTIVSAASREATLDPGDLPDTTSESRGRGARRAAAALIVLGLVGGRLWWLAEDGAYANAVYRPSAATVTTGGTDASPTLSFAIDSLATQSRSWLPIVPDHGKMMHLFLVKRGDLGAMAHLHPVALDSMHFQASLPSLPPGEYHVFADIVRESGFAETMVQRVTLTGRLHKWKPTDEDDASFKGGGVGTPFRFDDGSTLSWNGAGVPRSVGGDAGLTFSLRDAKGEALTVAPYLGMAAHAVVVKIDGSVFVHLHPSGSASMGAQQALESWTPADTLRGSIRDKLSRASGAMTMSHEELPGEFSFPYAFPSAGKYRVWVQFRQGRAIRSAAFDVSVGER